MPKESTVLKKVVEMLTQPMVGKAEIAQLLIQNDVEISEEDLALIIKNDKFRDDIEEVPYELSEDKKSFLTTELESLPKEIKKSFVQVPTKEEARFLADIYYQVQDKRIAVDGQIRAIKKKSDNQSADETKNTSNMAFLEFLSSQFSTIEDNIKKAIEAFSDGYYMSRYAKQIKGIGPIIATNLAAMLEIKSPDWHAGNWWSYAGLNDNNRPWLGREKSKQIVEDAIKENGGILDESAVYLIAARSKWSYAWLESKAKGKKGWTKDGLIKACSFIPYNKDLKVLMFKIGQSIRKVMNRDGSKYGHFLKEREAYENVHNAAGDYSDQAAKALKEKNYGKDTIAYSYYIKGQLPPAHIKRRAERWVTKLILSHIFEAYYQHVFGVPCPEPYIIGFDESGHNDYIEPEVPYDSVK